MNCEKSSLRLVLLFQYKNRRCLLDTECLNFLDYRTVQCDDVTGVGKNCLKLVLAGDTSKPGQCVEHCPAGYDVDPQDQQKCEPCKGKCPKSM